MHKWLNILFLTCVAVCSSVLCRASHIFGGELLYTHITGNNYRLTLTLYGDCGSNAPLFAQLLGARPLVAIYNGSSSVFDTVSLAPAAGNGREVSPVCPSQISMTTCNNMAGTLPGVKQFIYTEVVSLPFASANWKFVFTGTLGGTYGAGRSDNITNARRGSVMQIEATLNNLSGPNSSPGYTTIPTPFYCINVLQQYNQGAVDSDGDSLSFHLVPAIASSGTTVEYNFPFSGAYPLATATGTFSFNSINGQLIFNPDELQNALVVCRVSEYRAGVLVGTSQREMTFIVHDDCDGVPPTPQVVALTGATLGAGNFINICKGNDAVSFTINIDNPNGDITTLKPANIPLGAITTVYDDSTSHPYMTFRWNTDTLTVGVYTFYLTIKNDHCPLSSTQTVAYTINVANLPAITVKELYPTQCVHAAGLQYTFAFGFSPRVVTVTRAGAVVSTFTDNSSPDTTSVIDSLPAGDYIATIRSDDLCIASVPFSVVDSGTLPVTGFNKSLCKGDAPYPLYVTPIASGAIIKWYETSGTLLSGPPTVNTEFEGTYNWYFTEQYKVCFSGPVPVSATVHPNPDVQVENIPQTICFGDIIRLEASGANTYTWAPETAIHTDTAGAYISILLPTTIVVTGTDAFGCTDTSSVYYSDIQPCCNFAYPNAFTPNGDGRNDVFRVVTHGNMRYYSLSVYNRWGQWIFSSLDPERGWNGTFGGEQCEAGTYYYIVRAECLIGRKEEKKGDITLIR